MDDPHLKNMYLGVGYITVHWAIAEQLLDMIVLVIFREFGGRKISPEIPRALTRKITFLKNCFKKIPKLKSRENDAVAILKAFSTLKETRHDFTHGAVSHAKSEDGRFKFIKFDYLDTDLAIRDVQFEPSKSQEFLEQIQGLGRDSAFLCAGLITEVATARIERLQRLDAKRPSSPKPKGTS